jgi:hypothetical protein
MTVGKASEGNQAVAIGARLLGDVAHGPDVGV